MRRRCLYCRRPENEYRSLHGLPLKNAELMQIWKEKLDLPPTFTPTKNSRLCSDHFAKKCFKTVKCGRILLPDSVPAFFSQQKRAVCCYCNNTKLSKPGIYLWKFPMNKPELLRKWLDRINKNDFLLDSDSFICSDHFEKRFLIRTEDGRKVELRIDAIPTIFNKVTDRRPILPVVHSSVLSLESSTVKLISSQSSGNSCKNCVAFRAAISQLQSTVKNAEKKENELKRRIESLEHELEQRSLRAANINSILSNILSQSQIQKLWSPTNKHQQQHWSEDEIVKSIGLYSASGKLYECLRTNSFPLPELQILQNWTQNIELTPGILQPVVKFFQTATQDMREGQKVCVLSFDTVEIKQSYSYDESSDATLATPTFALLGLLRGLTDEWQQPIYYAFDTNMTWLILKDILNAVADSGFIIAAIVCDQLGGHNKELKMHLQITQEQPWFLHNLNKIYVFSDTPNLLKTLINYFFSHGFVVNKKEIKRNIASKLLASYTNKNNSKTVNNKYDDEQPSVSKGRNKIASKDVTHFSQYVGKLGNTEIAELEKDIGEQCQKMFKIINDWFDVMNATSISTSESGEGTLAYGRDLATQNPILDKMTKLMTSMRVIGQRLLFPFQKEIIQNNNAIELLFKDLEVRFGASHVITRQLNMGDLEKTLDMLSSKQGLEKLPDREDFRYRLTSHILGNYCEDTQDKTPLTASILKNFPWPRDEDFKALDSVDLENAARYILQKLNTTVKSDEYCLLVYNQSEGVLSKPSTTMMKHLESLNNIFKSFNKDDLVICSRYQRKLMDLAKDVQCHSDVKKLFFRARMYWRINTLNRKISKSSNTKKRKYSELST